MKIFADYVIIRRMLKKITNFADYFQKIPAAFLVAIISVLAFILFLPEETAKTVAVDEFRNLYRAYLVPAFLLVASFCIARIFLFFKGIYFEKLKLKAKQKYLHQLTPKEKGYLLSYLEEQKNTIYAGMDDGIMGGLLRKGITYRACVMGDLRRGFAYNLHPWAMEYLKANPHLLDGHVGRPNTTITNCPPPPPFI